MPQTVLPGAMGVVNPEVPFKPEMGSTNGGFVKTPGVATSNPGFQMNPLSKQRRNAKDKDSK